MARDYQNFPKNTRKCKGVPEIITKCQKFQESTRNFKKALEITRKGHRITESTTIYQKLQGSTRKYQKWDQQWDQKWVQKCAINGTLNSMVIQKVLEDLKKERHHTKTIKPINPISVCILHDYLRKFMSSYLAENVKEEKHYSSFKDMTFEVQGNVCFLRIDLSKRHRIHSFGMKSRWWPRCLPLM